MTCDLLSSRFFLFHGTSLRRLENIRRQNCVHMSQELDRRVSLTTSYLAAEYAACEAVGADFFYDELIQDVKSQGRKIDDLNFGSCTEYFNNNMQHNLCVAAQVHFIVHEDAQARIAEAARHSVLELARSYPGPAPGAPNGPVVLVLDGDRMFDLGYRLTPYRNLETEDEKFENEIACRQPIDPLEGVFIRQETVPSLRLEDFLAGRRAFMPARRIAQPRFSRALHAHMLRSSAAASSESADADSAGSVDQLAA